VRIHICGARGSTPAPGADFLRYGGHTSCLALAHDGQDAPSLILDAGTGIRTVTPLLGGRAFTGTTLLTHLHWDHLQGLPFFAAGDREGAQVTLVLPEQHDEQGAEAVLARVMSPPHFPVGPDQLAGDWRFATIPEGERQIEGFTVLAREVPHGGGRTFGYRISDGHSALCYVPDHAPTVLGDGPEGHGEYHQAALELASGVDVLVHDAHFLSRQELDDQGFSGHSVADYAAGLGRAAGARTVALFHHHPDRTDSELDQLASRFDEQPAVSPAAQGDILRL
jgi:phosphoribosyl 1,2-cyclic phosphodiesterase